MHVSKIAIRVVLAEDGKTPVRSLWFDGVKIGDVSYVEVIEFIAQAIGTFRWEAKR